MANSADFVAFATIDDVMTEYYIIALDTMTLMLRTNNGNGDYDFASEIGYATICLENFIRWLDYSARFDSYHAFGSNVKLSRSLFRYSFYLHHNNRN